MNYKKSIKNFLLIFVLFTFLPKLSIAASPESAYYVNNHSSEDALVATICKVANIFTGPTVQALVVIVIITTGISMFFGKMTWIMATIVMIGVGIVFGSENIVNTILGSTLHCKSYKDFYIAR